MNYNTLKDKYESMLILTNIKKEKEKLFIFSNNFSAITHTEEGKYSTIVLFNLARIRNECPDESCG
jgi:hypothetical protein